MTSLGFENIGDPLGKLHGGRVDGQFQRLDRAGR